MSGIAEVLVNLSYKVSGSDLASSATTERLRDAARKCMWACAVDMSRPPTPSRFERGEGRQPEVVAARERSIPVVPRAQTRAS